jgi:hypothetical protein
MEKWIYKSAAKKQFKLTDNQIATAVAKRLVAAKTVKNPHYRSGPPALLLNVADLKKNLEQVKGLPKLAPQENVKKKVYYARKKVRDKIEFFCPRCGKKIRALRGSEMFEACFSGQVSPEEARKVLMIAHYRHAHTNYDEKLSRLQAERYKSYLKFRNEGFDFETAWSLVNDENPDEGEAEDLKKAHNKEAVELLKKDGLLL